MDLKGLRVLAAWNMSFHWFSIGLIIPVMTLFLLEKGLSLAQVGMAGAAYGAAVVLLELPTGGLADTIGRKKVYLYSLLFLVVSAALLLVAKSFSALLFCFVMQGVARSLSSGTMDAYFIDEFYKIDSTINLQEEMARIGIFIPVGLGLAALLGGIIPMTLGNLTLSHLFYSRYASNYIVLIVAILIQFLTTLFLIHEEKRGDSNVRLIAGFRNIPEVVGVSMKYGLKHSVVLLLLLASFVWGFSISGLEQLWQPQVKSIIIADSGSWIYGFLTAGYFMAAALGNILVTPLCRLFKNNYPLVLFLSRFVMGVLYFILAFQYHIILFSIFYISLFMFNGIQGSPESSLFNDAVPSDKRSTLLSFSSLFMQTGGILGSVILGVTAQVFSIKTAWIIASVVITASALLYLLIPLYREKREEKQNHEF